MKTLLCVISLVCAVCAQNSMAPPAACGPSNAQFQIKIETSAAAPQADSGKALIYVVEDQKFKYARNVTVRVGMDGKWLGATRGNSHLLLSVEPGEHHFCVDWMLGFAPPGRLFSLYGLTAEAGKVYYFRARTMASPPSGSSASTSIDLDLVNRDEGEYLVAATPLSVSSAKK